jgi:hypothetical protein
VRRKEEKLDAVVQAELKIFEGVVGGMIIIEEETPFVRGRRWSMLVEVFGKINANQIIRPAIMSTDVRNSVIKGV